jgi:hypothetical protein
MEPKPTRTLPVPANVVSRSPGADATRVIKKKLDMLTKMVVKAETQSICFIVLLHFHEPAKFQFHAGLAVKDSFDRQVLAATDLGIAVRVPA